MLIEAIFYTVLIVNALIIGCFARKIADAIADEWIWWRIRISRFIRLRRTRKPVRKS